MSEPTINDAKALAMKYRKRGVLIISFAGGQVASVSYGMTRADCDAMGHVNDQIHDMLTAGDIEVPEQLRGERMKTATKLTERAFQRQVIQLAKLYGWRVAHFRPAMVRCGDKVKYVTPVEADGAGFPDLVMVHVKRHRVLYVELKVGKNITSPEQAAWLDDLHTAGEYATVWKPEMWGTIEAVLKGT